MKGLLIFCLAFTAGSCAFTGSLLVRFGLLPPSEHFMKLPLTTDAATAEGWEITDRPDGPMPSLTMYCFKSKIVCVLYDDTNNVAGLQVAFPIDDFKNAVYDMEVTGFVKWTPEADGKTFWAIQQYFVSPEYLALSAEERTSNRTSGKILQTDGVWVTGINQELTKISTDYKQIKDSEFTQQACIPLMGRHFYHNMSASLECSAETIFPWFSLVHSGELVASGLMVFGQFAEDKEKDWFERPDQSAVKLIVNKGPECLYDLAASPGVVTMHIYYIDNPYSLTCFLQ